MAIAIVNVEGVHLALFLKRFCHSQSLGARHKVCRSGYGV
jgi:hypothetical protein